MDNLSWRRWQEFSDRMARTCYAEHKDPDLAWILSEVHHFFDCRNEWEIAAFYSWDNSNEYPRESGYYAHPLRRCDCRQRVDPQVVCLRCDTYKVARESGLDEAASSQYVELRCWDTPCCCRSWHERYRGDAFAPAADCETCGGDRDWRQMSTGSLPCDITLEHESDSLPFWECEKCERDGVRFGEVGRYYASIDAGLDSAQARRYSQWRRAEHLWWRCSCDEDRYAHEEAWLDKWFGPVRCCLRAGIDFANDANGGGVLGFTAKDIRDMWPGEDVPEWVFRKDQRLWEGTLGGPYVENGTFASLPDDAAVVL